MLHLIKLCVGVRSLDELEARMQVRDIGGGRARIRTRQQPRRADEIVGLGSLYWVIGGLLRCRQPIVGIEEARDQDGTRTTAIELERSVVPVEPRAVRAFQGWRYLRPEDAPRDLRPGADGLQDELPQELRRRLAELCLL